MKTCTKCNLNKELSEFNKTKKSKDGYKTICRNCQKVESKEYYLKTHDFQLNRKKGQISHTKLRITERNELFLNNQRKCIHCDNIKQLEDFGLDKQKPEGYSTICKECRNIKLSEKYKENPLYSEEKRNKSKLYYENNVDTCIQKSIEYKKKRSKVDPLFALKKRIKRRIYDIVKKRNWGNSSKKDEYLGCSYSELKRHIESLFEPGMTWENNTNSGWHIDHIIPMSLASNPEEAKKLNYYKNLKPLWANDNLSKGPKFNIPNRSRNLSFLELLPNEQNKKHLIESKNTIKTRIFARKCEIKLVDDIKAERDFLNKYHLQDYRSSTVAYGLYFNNELVSLMSFGEPLFNKEFQWEIIRYVTKENIIVVGGASKLFNYFIKDNDPESLITYSDLRFGTGDVYSKIGMTFIGKTSPNYFYIKNNVVLSRYQAMKKNLIKRLPIFLSKLSEYENMMINGYERVFDLGNNKFIWTK